MSNFNTNSVWNFAEKHPFLFYSCVSSVVGGAVKIVRTLKGEPKPVSVMVSDTVAERTKAAVKETVKTAADKLFEEVVEKDEEEADISEETTSEADPGFCFFLLDKKWGGVEHDGDYVVEALKMVAKECGIVTVGTIAAHSKYVSKPWADNPEWGWNENEFINKSEHYNTLLILPPPHKLESED